DDQMPASRLLHSIALSPDGTQIVYVANSRLYRRSLSQLEAQPIPGTDASGVSDPVFSPDGQSVAFRTADGTIKRIPISGGSPVPLVAIEVVGFFGGMSWTDDGIVWAVPGVIARVSANGGRPDTMATLKATENVNSPQILPGGKTVLYTLATSTEPDRWEK